jgi:hypothetical protein
MLGHGPLLRDHSPFLVETFVIACQVRAALAS